jgi:hypothetical protein
LAQRGFEIAFEMHAQLVKTRRQHKKQQVTDQANPLPCTCRAKKLRGNLWCLARPRTECDHPDKTKGQTRRKNPQNQIRKSISTTCIKWIEIESIQVSKYDNKQTKKVGEHTMSDAAIAKMCSRAKHHTSHITHISIGAPRWARDSWRH